MRYNHYIKPCGEGKWPERILCVACSSRELPALEGRRWTVHELDGWNWLELVRREGEYRPVGSCAGTTRSGFWQSLGGGIDRPVTTYIISHDCGRVWSLLGLWEEIESGRVSITADPSRVSGTDYSAMCRVRRTSNNPIGCVPASTVSQMSERGQGYLVLEDPPCIAGFVMPGLAGRYVWVDTRNYGVEVGGAASSSHETCHLLERLVVSLTYTLLKHLLGALCTTAGSQVLRAWRYSYLERGVYAHTVAAGLEIESRGYYGGRCECARIGTCPVPTWYLDVRSLYPSVCAGETLPVRLVAVARGRPGEESGDRGGRLGVIATVDLETEEAAYPYRRIRPASSYNEPGRPRPGQTVWNSCTDIIYPIGRFTTTLCGPELADAVALGRVKKWHKYATYELSYCLRDLALRLYDIRCKAEQDGDRLLAQWAKRLLVCLSGKFGQNDWRWQPCTGDGTVVMYGEWWAPGPGGTPCKYRAVAGKVFRQICMGWAHDAVPAIAAWITSAGRMRLLEVIRLAGWENCYYWDTDSVMCGQTGFQLLVATGAIGSRELGKLEIRDLPKVTEIVGIKHYLRDGKRTCAGLPRGSSMPVEGAAQYTYREGISEAIRGGLHPSADTVTRTYQRREPYRHGVVHPDGAITPIVLEEW